jgi:hypothetical protein
MDWNDDVNQQLIGTVYLHPKRTPSGDESGGSARAVGAGRGCGDGASAVGLVIIATALEAPAVVSGAGAIPLSRAACCHDVKIA